MEIVKRFVHCAKLLLGGYDVGLRPNPLFIGERPHRRNRKQRRAEGKYWDTTKWKGVDDC